jgi:hypothetical protein
LATSIIEKLIFEIPSYIHFTYCACNILDMWHSMKYSSHFFRENDKHTPWWLICPHFSALIQNEKHQLCRVHIYVVDAVLMVTRGHKKLKNNHVKILLWWGFEVI